MMGSWGRGIIESEDWLAINRSRDGYVRIRDGLVLEGEV